MPVVLNAELHASGISMASVAVEVSDAGPGPLRSAHTTCDTVGADVPVGEVEAPTTAAAGARGSIDGDDVASVVAALTAMHAGNMGDGQIVLSGSGPVMPAPLSNVVDVSSWWTYEHIQQQFSLFEAGVQWIISPAGLFCHSASYCGMHKLRSLQTQGCGHRVVLHVLWQRMIVCFRRGFVCRRVYTATEAFTRLLLQHAMLGKGHETFKWQEYAAARKRALQAPNWFCLEPATQRVVDEILEAAVFDRVMIPSQPTPQRGSASGERNIGAQPWLAFKLRPGKLRPNQFKLAPLEARASREESATRLALEAGRLEVRWDAVVERHDMAPAQSSGDRTCSCASRKRKTLSS
jgi:hypothetical protein